MKARLLKKWGSNYAGQVLTNVQEGSIPSDVAEFFEDDDPAVNTVVAQEDVNDPLMVINDEINPETAEAHNTYQRELAEYSRAVDARAVGDALEEQERKDTQDRARQADEFAAQRGEEGAAALTESQKDKLKAGKGHGNIGKAGKARAAKPVRPVPARAAKGSRVRVRGVHADAGEPVGKAAKRGRKAARK